MFLGLYLPFDILKFVRKGPKYTKFAKPSYWTETFLSTTGTAVPIFLRPWPAILFSYATRCCSDYWSHGAIFLDRDCFFYSNIFGQAFLEEHLLNRKCCWTNIFLTKTFLGSKCLGQSFPNIFLRSIIFQPNGFSLEGGSVEALFQILGVLIEILWLVK